jgi:hypothetical protein
MSSEKKKEKYFCMAAERGDLPESLEFESLEFESLNLKALEKIVFGRKQIRPFQGVSRDVMPGQSNNCITCRFARRTALKA